MITIKNRKIGPGRPCFIIAEIGINHNGSLPMALELITAAVKAGAEAVKFQKRTVPLVYTSAELAAPRPVDLSIIRNGLERRVIEGTAYPVFPPESIERLERIVASGQASGLTTNGDLKYALEFGQKEYDLINAHCLELGVTWSASAWDGQSAHMINGFEDVQWLKIASACLTNRDLLRRVRAKGKPIILSTGGSTLEQVQHAVRLIGQDDLALLHCVALYPPSDADTNLSVMETLRNMYPGVPVGYSSHSVDILAPVAAVARGASIIEAHLTLDTSLPGSDHKASLSPDQFKQMVDMCRRVEKMRGDGVKRVLPDEVTIMKKLRRVDDLFGEVSPAPAQ